MRAVRAMVRRPLPAKMHKTGMKNNRGSLSAAYDRCNRRVWLVWREGNGVAVTQRPDAVPYRSVNWSVPVTVAMGSGLDLKKDVAVVWADGRMGLVYSTPGGQALHCTWRKPAALHVPLSAQLDLVYGSAKLLPFSSPASAGFLYADPTLLPGAKVLFSVGDGSVRQLGRIGRAALAGLPRVRLDRAKEPRGRPVCPTLSSGTTRP